MSNEKKLPTLTDSDIVTNNDNRKPVVKKSGINISTLALALTLTTASGTMLSGCSDGTDCDSDTNNYADPLADTGAGADPSDTSDSDLTTTADSKPCD